MADHPTPPFPAVASPLVGREREQAALRAALAARLDATATLAGREDAALIPANPA